MSVAAVAAGAAEAPAAPGVYFLVGGDGELLYVGKAGHLRRRLQQHAKAAGAASGHGRVDTLYRRTERVQWEVAATEGDAAAREADLIVALQPSCNAAIVGEGRWPFVVTRASGAGELAIELCRVEPASRAGLRVYGCFPHLGGGLSSRPGNFCGAGYLALLRLLWADTATGDHYPAAVTGAAPPAAFRCIVDEARRPPLHALLSGVSDRLLRDLAQAVEIQEPYRRPALRRDLEAASAFFRAGPAHLRRLRLRHGLPAGPVSRATQEARLRAEVEEIIGRFHSTERPGGDA